MASLRTASTWTAMLSLGLVSGCSSSDGGGLGPNPESTTTGGGGATTSGTGGKGTSSNAVASSSVVVAASGAGGSDTFNCDPPAAAGSIYELAGDSFGAVEPVSMCRYRGDVMLIVDTAAL